MKEKLDITKVKMIDQSYQYDGWKWKTKKNAILYKCW